MFGGRRDFSTLTYACFYDVQGGDIDVSDMGNVLNEMGITLTVKENKELLEHLPITCKCLKCEGLDYNVHSHCF
jgi:hypothetical protein